MVLNPSTAILIALWFWIATGVAGVVFAIYLTVREGPEDVMAIAATMGVELASSGVLTLGVAGAGWPAAALFLWRGTAFIGVAIGVTILSIAWVKSRRERLAAPESNAPSSAGVSPTVVPTATVKSVRAVWTTIVGTLVMALLFLLSFQSHSIPLSVEAISSSARAQAATTITAATASWIGLLVALGVGVIFFLFLFVRRLEHGGAPQIETHWGGIGGGLGGWRMSSSLGYLSIATVLAVVFSIFFLRFQDWARQPAEVTVTAKPTATPARSPAPASGKASANRAVEEPAESSQPRRTPAPSPR